MTGVYGCRKNRAITGSQVKFRENERDYYLEKEDILHLVILFARYVASRAANERCDAGYGVGNSKMAVYL